MDAPKTNGTALDLGGIMRLFEIKVCPIVMREQGLEEDKRKKKKRSDFGPLTRRSPNLGFYC